MTKQTTTVKALLKIIGLYIHYGPPYLANVNKAIRDSCPQWKSMKPDYSDEFTSEYRITVNEKDKDVFLYGNFGRGWLAYICPSDYKQSFFIDSQAILSYLEESISLTDLMFDVERWDIGESIYFHNTYISYQFARAETLYYMNGLFTNNMLGHQFMNWNGNPLEVMK